MRIITVFLVLIFANNLNAQQAWTQKKGEGYFQIGSSVLSYSALHDGAEKIDIPRPISETIVSFYGEYGFSDLFTVSLVVPYIFVSSGDLAPEWEGFAPTKSSLSALGNVSGALTYKFYDRDSKVLSCKLGLSLNSGKSEGSSGLRTGFNSTSFSPSLLAGIGTNNYFASAETGVNFMNNNYLHRYFLHAQVGKQLLKNKRLIFIFGVSISTSLGSDSVVNNFLLDRKASFTGLYLNEQAFYSASLKFGYELTKNWSIWTAVSGGAAKNVGRAPNFYISIGYKLKEK